MNGEMAFTITMTGEKFNMLYYNEKFPIVRDMIHILYEYCCVGGCCHVVTDDDNIYDDDLEWVISYAENERKNEIDSELSAAICKILKSMTFLQRAVLFDSLNEAIGDYCNKEEFDAEYDTSEEHLKEVIRAFDWREEYINCSEESLDK